MTRRLRIRTKLLIWLFVAGAVPLVAASLLSVITIRGRLNENLSKETDRSLRIGLNLVLSRVELVSADAARLGQDRGLRALLKRYNAGELFDPKTLSQNVGRVVARHEERMALGEVVLVDNKDRPIARKYMGRAHSTDPQIAPDRSSAKANKPTKNQRKNRFLHTVDIVAGPKLPMIRAEAPVVDENFDVLGTVVVLVPLDARFAEMIRATLGMHVGFYLGRRPAASSFRDDRGRPRPGLILTRELIERVLAGRARVGVGTVKKRTFAVGVLPLVNARHKPVGLFYVALDRQRLEAGKWRSYRALFYGGLGVFLLALLIASIVSHGLSRPLTELHGRAMAVAKGDLSGHIGLKPGNELGDLGRAFDDMTDALRENQRRLGARISEIVTLQNIGRAVRSEVGLERVLQAVVEEVRRALESDATTILLSDGAGELTTRAQVGLPAPPAGDEPQENQSALPTSAVLMAQAAFREEKTLCIDQIEEHPTFGEQAVIDGLRGSAMIAPLWHKERGLGVMMVHRGPEARAFGEADLRLLATFADQAATAIENARLQEQVTVFNDRLDLLVSERTAESSRSNAELSRALESLEENQGQLLLSERLTGLGQLVAGMAHEVSTPASAIGAAVDDLDRGFGRLAELSRQLANQELSVAKWNALMQEVQQHVARQEPQPLPVAEARAQAQALEAKLTGQGVTDSPRLARRLVDLDAAESALRLLALTGPNDVLPLMGCLKELMLLRGDALAIRTAVGTINRIVKALLAYSRLDHDRVERVNLHDGIESTLIILASRLKPGITVHRRYGDLPQVRIYAAELNQVWTNLLVNALDAIGDKGEISIETQESGEEVVVRVVDNGDGISPDVLPRVFRPFFTTKAGGHSTGLGLGIVRRIVEKHGGRIEADSVPGRTIFTVTLPVEGPPSAGGEPDTDRGAEAE